MRFFAFLAVLAVGVIVGTRALWLWLSEADGWQIIALVAAMVIVGLIVEKCVR